MPNLIKKNMNYSHVMFLTVFMYSYIIIIKVHVSLLVPAVKQTLAQGSRGHVVTQTLAGAQRNQLKEAGAGNFRSVTLMLHKYSALLNI